MKIFGYKFSIEKAVSNKRIIIIPKATDGRVNCFYLSGDDWGMNEEFEVKDMVNEWIQKIESNFPNLLAKDIVQLLNIFAGELYKFELQP